MSERHKFREFVEFLIDFGLTPKQARVYLTALQLGQASVQAIASEAGVERTNTYDAIKILVEKRFMSTTSVGKRRMFIAEPPDRIEEILNEKQAAFHRILPELRSLHNVSGTKPRIRFYPELQGYKAVYEDTLTTTERRLFGIFSMKDVLNVLGREYLRYIVDRRVKLGIRLRVIRSREREIPSMYPTDQEELREVRIAPKGIVFPISTYVYDNKVIILSSKKEMFGLIIESADVAKAHRNYFEALWQISQADRTL